MKLKITVFKKNKIMTDIFLEEYTSKSFVIRGDTKEYKDSLKAMGGKWNSSLTDKRNGEKFGAWLFWSDKRKEINDWIANGCSKVETDGSSVATTNSRDDNSFAIKRLESKIDALTKMLETFCKTTRATKQVDSDVESDDEPPVKPKRLLSTRAR
jgi:hypothetical protein